jgi:hypothetical protein
MDDEDRVREMVGWALAAVAWTVAERATVWVMDRVADHIRGGADAEDEPKAKLPEDS